MSQSFLSKMKIIIFNCVLLYTFFYYDKLVGASWEFSHVKKKASYSDLYKVPLTPTLLNLKVHFSDSLDLRVCSADKSAAAL